MALSKRTFGVELECIVRHDKPLPPVTFHNTIADHIAAFGVNVIKPIDPNFLDYRSGLMKRHDWLITHDASLDIDYREFRYSRERMEFPKMSMFTWVNLWKGVEVISPVLDESHWDKVAIVLQALDTPPVGVYHNKSTSTHVHVGVQVPGLGPNTTEEALEGLKRIASLWYLFEGYINLLHPAFRMNNFCRRTRKNKFAKDTTQMEFINEIYNSTEVQNVHNIMNNLGYWKCDVTNVWNYRPSRLFGANFENLILPHKWTIEFRALEGTKDLSDLQCWAKIVMRFCDQAIITDWSYIKNLIYYTDKLNDNQIFGHENSRPVEKWQQWAQIMQNFWLNFLAGDGLRAKFLNEQDPPSLENSVLNIPWELTHEEENNPGIKAQREEELLLKTIAVWSQYRRDKHHPLHADLYSNWEGFHSDSWSDDDEDPRPEAFIDFPNPSGIVADETGKDLPLSAWQEAQPDYELYRLRVRS